MCPKLAMVGVAQFVLQRAQVSLLFWQPRSVSALARSNNVSEERVEGLWAFRTSAVFSEAERMALRFALVVPSRPSAASEAEFEDLREHYSEDQIVEMIAVLSIGVS